MGEQVTNRDVSIAGSQLRTQLITADVDGCFVERRDEGGDGVVESEVALVDQHKHGDCGDGLGHGGDAEDGVGPHQLAGLDVPHTDGKVLDDLALLPDQHHRPGDLSVVAGAPEQAIQFGQTGVRHFTLLRSLASTAWR